MSRRTGNEACDAGIMTDVPTDGDGTPSATSLLDRRQSCRGLSCGKSKSQCINANLYTSMAEAVIVAVVEAVAKEREDIDEEHYANCIEIGKSESAI